MLCSRILVMNGSTYSLTAHKFRGCADALFIHDNKCTVELQRKKHISTNYG